MALEGPALLVTGPDAGARAGAGVRYGLGLKYNLTERIGLQAEMERFSPLAAGARASPTRTRSPSASPGATSRSGRLPDQPLAGELADAL